MGREEMAVLRKAGRGPGPSRNWLLQRNVRLSWACHMEESLPVFQKEKVVSKCNR